MTGLSPQYYDKAAQVSKDTFEKMLTMCLPLLSHHNIVFNGAPGTGKTYMAKQIAKMLEAKTKFVQFHPSYDYTDFVEGLRPVTAKSNNLFSPSFSTANCLPNRRSIPAFRQSFPTVTSTNAQNSIGFERRDGIFKAFCREAAENMAASMGKEIDWENGSFKTKAIDPIPLKKFVFIIDEINRGDMSKIFGELFYNIEQSYRVPANKDEMTLALEGDSKYAVQTQYQNLIGKGEPFHNGFFIPENVYVIGTMNDIDRSVESMDFAMRRRFAFVEVKPEDTVGMLYSELTPELAKKASDKMTQINDIIKNNENGLGEEYQIGPAYFLDLKHNPNFYNLWLQRIQPLLKEYCRGNDREETEKFINDVLVAALNPKSKKIKEALTNIESIIGDLLDWEDHPAAANLIVAKLQKEYNNKNIDSAYNNALQTILNDNELKQYLLPNGKTICENINKAIGKAIDAANKKANNSTSEDTIYFISPAFFLYLNNDLESEKLLAQKIKDVIFDKSKGKENNKINKEKTIKQFQNNLKKFMDNLSDNMMSENFKDLLKPEGENS